MKNKLRFFLLTTLFVLIFAPLVVLVSKHINPIIPIGFIVGSSYARFYDKFFGEKQ